MGRVHSDIFDAWVYIHSFLWGGVSFTYYTLIDPYEESVLSDELPRLIADRVRQKITSRKQGAEYEGSRTSPSPSL